MMPTTTPISQPLEWSLWSTVEVSVTGSLTTVVRASSSSCE